MLAYIGEYCRGYFLIINHIQIGSGQDIIFLHGWGGSTASFYNIANRLKHKYRVTLLDFYGFGKTPMQKKPLFVRDYAESVIELINHYKMNDIILVGHSFGGRVAIYIASKFGYLLNKLILVDSAGLLPHRGIIYHYKVTKHKILRHFGITHKAGSKDYQQLNSIEKQTFINVVNEDLTDLAKKITVPTLIFWGSKDKETAIYMAKKLKRIIYGSCLVMFKGAGHYSYLDEPDLFYKLTVIFLSEVGYGMVVSNSFDNFKLGGVTKIIYTKSSRKL